MLQKHGGSRCPTCKSANLQWPLDEKTDAELEALNYFNYTVRIQRKSSIQRRKTNGSQERYHKSKVVEYLNREIQRRTSVVGIFPNEVTYYSSGDNVSCRVCGGLVCFPKERIRLMVCVHTNHNIPRYIYFCRLSGRSA